MASIVLMRAFSPNVAPSKAYGQKFETRSEATEQARAAHENQRTWRLNIVSTIGDMMSIPPRINNMAKTIETPSIVYANVVVTTTKPVQIPESNVQMRGRGNEMLFDPRLSFHCVAYFHQPMMLIKHNMTMIEAMIVGGKISPLETVQSLTNLPASGSAHKPLVKTFVKNEYGT